ncbi:MAG: hypothetical protein K2H47_02090 [Muribaculaceae bacterium]|nr:hypothetical protein [Muribaculaceae bacterium]
MKEKNLLPKDIYDEEAVKFVARRYGTTPERVLKRYLLQVGLLKCDEAQNQDDYELAPNEIALFRDFGVSLSTVE